MGTDTGRLQPIGHRPVRVDRLPTEVQPQLREVAKAYRWARGIGMQPAQAEEVAVWAHVAAGGTYALARAEVPIMIRSVGEWHTSWFRRPRLDREVREEEALKRLGWWPPPDDIKGRQVWAEEAVKRAFTPPPDRAEIDRRYGDIMRRHQALITEARRRAEAAAFRREREGGGEDHQPLGPSIASGAPESETPQRS